MSPRAKKKPAAKPPVERVVTIAMHVYPTETMFLRQHVGSATQGDSRWEFSTNVADNTPIIRLPDGRWVTVGWGSLLEAANKAGEP